MRVLHAALSVSFVFALSVIGRGEHGHVATAAAISFAHAEHPPFTLEVTAVKHGGDLELTATLALHEPLPVPIEVTVTLPKGNTLVTGRAYERIVRPARGDTLVRTFRLRGGDHAPFTVHAEQQIGEVMGAHATRTWPPAAPERVDTPWAPIGPTAHGAVVVSQAIVVASVVGP